MGGRADVLIRAAETGHLPPHRPRSPQPLMTVVVAGTPRSTPMPLPTDLPGRPTRLPAPIRRREVTFRSYDNVFAGPFPNAYRILGTGATPHADPTAGVKDRRWGRFDPDVVNHRLHSGRGGGMDGPQRLRHALENHPFPPAHQPLLGHLRRGTPLSTPVWHDTISIPQHSYIVFRVHFPQTLPAKPSCTATNSSTRTKATMQIVEYTT